MIENPNAKWPDKERFVSCGRWGPGQRTSYKYLKCAVRTERWRFVNNSELYDVI